MSFGHLSLITFTIRLSTTLPLISLYVSFGISPKKKVPFSIFYLINEQKLTYVPMK